MGFPNIDVNSVKAHLKSAFNALGSDAVFTLRDGTTFSIKVSFGFRGSQDMTDGLQQETLRVKFIADDWDDASPGRQPEKGDQVVFDGHRYAIQTRVRTRPLADERFLYVCEIRG